MRRELITEKYKRDVRRKALDRIQKGYYQAWALTEILTTPWQWLHLLEGQPLWFRGRALRAASGIFSPSLFFKRLKTITWHQDEISFLIQPRRTLFNRVQLSDLATLCEFVLQIYWRRFLTTDSERLTIKKLQWTSFHPLDRSGLRIVYGMPSMQRDLFLFQLSQNGKVVIETTVVVLDESQIRVGIFEVELRIEQSHSLGGALPSPGIYPATN